MQPKHSGYPTKQPGFFSSNQVGFNIGGVLRGAGDTRWPFVISLLGMWVVRLPLAYTLIHLFDWGLAAVWGAAIADWAVRAAISCHRFYHKKWMTQKV